MKHKIAILLLLATICVTWAVPREMVILEIGTGTWCPYCPGASMGAHDLIEAGYNVAAVKNHNGDPYANTFSNTRNSYYAITGYPTALFDGLNPMSGGSYSQSLFSSYLPRINARLAIPSRYTITSVASINSGVLTVDVTVSKPEEDSNTNVYLRSYLTESNIVQNWQGQTRLDNVTRLMAPDATGTPISLSTGESTTVTLTFTLNSAWQVPNLELVLFLQNNTSKEILQGKKYNVAGFTGTASPVSTDNLVFPDTFVNGLRPMPITLHNYCDAPVSGTLSSSDPAFIPEQTEFNISGASSLTIDINFAPQTAGNLFGILTVTGNFLNHPVIEIPMMGLAFINNPPVAQDVSLSGIPVVLQDISAEYSFSDPDGDPEGNSIYQWYRIDEESHVPIANANELTYRVSVGDVGFPLIFGVTPVDQFGMPGEEVFSEPTATIIDIPAPQNFSGVLQPPSTVLLTWQKPIYFDTRGFVGYRIFRNTLQIATITNVNTLTFTDANIPDGNYEYWIISLFTNPVGNSAPSPSVFITVGETSNEDLVTSAQYGVALAPNPFRAETNFMIRTKANREVQLSVFNLRGQQLKSWQTVADAQGNATLNWDGRDHRGTRTESGIYLYRMESDGKVFNGKIIRVSK